MTLLAMVVLVALGVTVYWNSFHGAFVFDDIDWIQNNTTIRQSESLGLILFPPLPGATVEGRPLLNLSFALNYALGGLNTWGFHFGNLLIHLGAGLALFGVIRRTLLLPAFRQEYGSASTGLALAVAAIWLVHPLQTESVTYMVQRAESLAGFFYLCTFYFSIRTFTQRGVWLWPALAIFCSFCGMGSKETMVTAPLLIFFYDAFFLSRSFPEAFNKHRSLYFGLFASWLLLATLLISSGTHGGTVGFGIRIAWQYYALTQCGAILNYLRLCFWPSPLIFDYGGEVTVDFWKALPSILGLGALLFGTLYALWKKPGLGFAGVAFFLILAPTSSVLPINTQTIAEHRMYLPLAAVVAATVIAGYAFARNVLPRFVETEIEKQLVSRSAPVAGAVLAIVALGATTIERNQDYLSEVTIWGDTVAKRPESGRALTNYGRALGMTGDTQGAIRQLTRAIELEPDNWDARNNLGAALATIGGLPEAIAQLEATLKTRPEDSSAHTNLGVALVKAGRIDEGIEHYRAALAIDPELVEAQNNLGNALARQGKVKEAIDAYRAALVLAPESIPIRANLEKARKMQEEKK
jgi:Flp pilus assembly protein TadD